MTIPNTVTGISGMAFSGCTGLEVMILPDSLTTIGSFAFSNCSSLASLKVSEDNRVFDSREKCNAIIESNTGKLIAGCMNTVIPEDVKEIGAGAFNGCAGLRSVRIPESVQAIGESVFMGCAALSQIILKKGSYADTWAQQGGYSAAVIYEGDPYYFRVKADGAELLKYCGTDSKLVLPQEVEGVTVAGIGTNLFAGQTGITEVTVPGQVKGFSIPTMSELNRRRMLFVRWKKLSGISGYEIRWSTKSFTSKQYKRKKISASTKTYDIADYSTIRKLSANYFYVKIRAYKKAGKNTYYGKWKKLKISGGA